MIVIDLKTKLQYDITVNRTGENHMTCPVCSESRKKKTDKCFSFNYSKGVGRCNHCNVILVEKRELEDHKYKRPEWKEEKTRLSEKAVDWFASRKISASTLIHFRISEGVEYMPQIQREINTIQFNYFENDDLVNIKYRDGKKNFKMVSEAKLIFYNIDAVRGCNEVIICEGEMDALSFHEAGFRNVISVPNGATIGRNNLTYLDNCVDYFLDETEFIIATDNDVAGNDLREELVRRLGVENCYKVTFNDCKDANECLIKYGREGIRQALENKKSYPVSGIFTANDISDEIDDYFHNGLPPGAEIGEKQFDELLKFHKGYMTTITGIPNHGKSEGLDYILLKLNILHKWKGGLYSPENYPLQLHFSKYAEKIIGKQFSKMNGAELAAAKKYFSENFFFIKPEEDNRLDSILDKTRYLIRKYGINFFVIDPWNKIEHEYRIGESETQYISRILDKLTMFCEKNMIHLFLVAHPTKISKDKNTGLFEVPNLYSINGSANFFNKTHSGITFYRNFNNNETEVYVQKVKFKHWGNVGVARWKWDFWTGRYYSFDEQPDQSNWLGWKGKQTNMDKYIEPKTHVIPGTEEAPF